MKKPYVKPEITFESFKLSTDISAGCAYISSGQEQFSCAALIPEWGETMLLDENMCDTYGPSVSDSICYHVPVAGMNIFES